MHHVIQYRRSRSLEQYEYTFREFEVEGYWFVNCDRETLADMGVRAMHARRIEEPNYQISCRVSVRCREDKE